jgi:hypothetical protein
LEEVQVSPVALKTVMNALVCFMAQRARQVFGIAAEFEVDTFLRRAEFNIGYTPRSSQPQSTTTTFYYSRQIPHGMTKSHFIAC